MITLAIETSCDETGVAVVQSKTPYSHRILVNLLASQIMVHQKFGGVVPGLAAREHVKNLPLLMKKALKEYTGPIDAVAYTDHPGLEPALLVGRTFAKTFAYALGIPAYPVNHLYGHIFASFLTDSLSSQATLFPAIALVISGGHTQLYLLTSPASITLLGETIDDAVGEALDKGARLLGLPYPGGPKIEALAKQGKPGTFTFPSPMMKSGDLRFSFAGLKTSLLYKVRDLTKATAQLDEQTKADLALAYQSAAFQALLAKTKKALHDQGALTLILGGGVSANQTLRDLFAAMMAKGFPHGSLLVPERQFSTDNAVMIALAHAIPALHKVRGKERNH